MFNHILVPIDLGEKDTLETAMRVAADLARLYTAKITLVSVVGGIHVKVTHSSRKYARLLAEFAGAYSEAHGVEVDSRIIDVPDPTVEVDRELLHAVRDTGADLVVMASHQPGWMEYLVNSHGGRLASHAPVSVFLVREGE